MLNIRDDGGEIKLPTTFTYLVQLTYFYYSSFMEKKTNNIELNVDFLPNYERSYFLYTLIIIQLLEEIRWEIGFTMGENLYCAPFRCLFY